MISEDLYVFLLLQLVRDQYIYNLDDMIGLKKQGENQSNIYSLISHFILVQISVCRLESLHQEMGSLVKFSIFLSLVFQIFAPRE
jgi:hypothetical protein